MTQEQDEKDIKKFEELWRRDEGYWNNIPNKHDLAKHFFMEGFRIMKEEMSKEIQDIILDLKNNNAILDEINKRLKEKKEKQDG